MACRVCSVSSNRTGRPVFLWRTVAIDAYRHDIAIAQFAVYGEVE
jgi:hypothetical protein